MKGRKTSPNFCTQTNYLNDAGKFFQKRLKEIALLFFVICTSPAIAQEKNKRELYQNRTILVNQDNIPTDSNALYFPASFFPKYKFTAEPIDSTSYITGKIWDHKNEGSNLKDTFYLYATQIPESVDSLRVLHLSRHLWALKEPLLFNKPTQKEIFRFTWLRTFDHPVSIRIEKTESEIWIHTKVGSGLGGYEPRKIKKEKKKRISITEWESFIELLDKHDFWNISSRASIPSTDGSNWIIEGSTPSQYFVVSGNSYEEGNPVNEIGMHLLRLSKLRIKSASIY